ncbi:hypothetical protein C8035_v004103 [Colletotrichum spinosum]|uniref:F-box domain-containing protein n=1 Tax=Colletotrichum spinosum TaxID=1347390 RepID=A0A4R8QVT1_9PEZI|nr:hypothetical protein C8035_v004103 [Colletotrichum spinosum]
MQASSLESLPPELLNEIFSHITDPRTLYHLVVASPASSRLFEYSQSGPQALDNVLSHSMAPQICAMVRGVALIRTANPENRRIASLKAFVEQFASPRVIKPTCPLAAPPLAQTLQHQPERTSRGILLTVRRIHHLTSACLEHYRERCLSIKPSRAVDPKIRWGEGGEKAWRQDFPGVPYQPAPMPPPRPGSRSSASCAASGDCSCFATRNAPSRSAGWTGTLAGLRNAYSCPSLCAVTLDKRTSSTPSLITSATYSRTPPLRPTAPSSRHLPMGIGAGGRNRRSRRHRSTASWVRSTCSVEAAWRGCFTVPCSACSASLPSAAFLSGPFASWDWLSGKLRNWSCWGFGSRHWTTRGLCTTTCWRCGATGTSSSGGGVS